jgi:LMBR1 domain-containing protein 1
MSNQILLLPLIILPILILCISVYLLALFSHPSEKSENHHLKLLIILGITISHICVLLIPLDLANENLIDMQLLWQIILWTMLIFVIILIPLAVIYYEKDEMDSVGKRLKETIWQFMLFFIVVLGLTFLFHFGYG